jgi:hypothetical protein
MMLLPARREARLNPERRTGLKTRLKLKTRTLTALGRKQALARRDRKLLAIARSVLDLKTLTARNSDSLDFHEHSVWCVKAALEEAFAAGAQAGFDFAQKGQVSLGS